VIRLLYGGPLMRWSAYCAAVRLLCGGPLIVRWSAYVMSAYYALVRLSAGAQIAQIAFFAME
jgi:hypothetical protein